MTNILKIINVMYNCKDQNTNKIWNFKFKILKFIFEKQKTSYFKLYSVFR